MNEKSLKFRNKHLEDFLKNCDFQHPVDKALKQYFQKNRSLGSKDRKWMSQKVFTYIKWKGTVDKLSPKSWDDKILHLESLNTEDLSSLAEHLQYASSEFFYKKLCEAYGKEKAQEICLINTKEAPLTIRANLLKTSREELLQELHSLEIPCSPCTKSDLGITLEKRLNLNSLKIYKDGFFEVQDEGSQILSNMVKVSKEESFLDFCSGSGGKTLSVGARMKNSGTIYIHDIRKNALKNAKKRCQRAGLKNIKVFSSQDLKSSSLEKKMDWILVDAPCSGTGTLRRNPHLKWTLNRESLDSLIELQAQIFEEALQYLHPDGSIIYGTCSILPEENQRQVENFCKKFELKIEEEFLSLPQSGKMDGFYGARMTT